MGPTIGDRARLRKLRGADRSQIVPTEIALPPSRIRAGLMLALTARQ
jgi:hypothetical protein